jgi:hypothetical protein
LQMSFATQKLNCKANCKTSFFLIVNKLYYETKRPIMEVMLLNEVVKHPLFKPNFDIGIFFIHFGFFNIHIIQ